MYMISFNTLSMVLKYTGLQNAFYKFSEYHSLSFSDVLKSVAVPMKKRLISRF